MSKKLFGKFFIFLLVVGLLFAVAPTGQAEAAIGVPTWVSQTPVAPTSIDTVLVLINQTTIEGENVGLEYFDGTTYTKIAASYDVADTYSGANWYATIPAHPVGTTVSYQLYMYYTDVNAGIAGTWSGFNWTYKVVDTSWYTGVGPYTISTVDQLAGLDALVTGGNNFAGKTINLSANLDLAGTTFAPIGTATNTFNGIFDGGNFTISNLTINSPVDFAGLFAKVSGGGSVKNLNMNNVSVQAYQYAGAVAGSVFTGSVSNVHVSDVNITSSHFGGGITGYSYGGFDNCSATNVTVQPVPEDTVEAGNKLGGIVGFMGEGAFVVQNCVATNVNISGIRDVGGIAGSAHQNNKFLNNRVVGGTVSAVDTLGTHADAWAGGVIGRLASTPVYLFNNTSTAIVSSYDAADAGQIIGGPVANAVWYNVMNTTQGTYFSTIQEAINAATAEDVIQVAAGSYAENLTINKALTLQGAGSTTTTVTGVAPATDAGVLRIMASDVTVEGFKFVAIGNKTVRITDPTSNVTIQNNHIVGAANTALAGTFTLLETDYNETQTDHVITGNIFEAHDAAQAVYYNPITPGLTFTDNTFTGTIKDGGVGVVVDALSGTYAISGNNFTALGGDPYGMMGLPGLTPAQMDAVFLANTFPAGYSVVGTDIMIAPPVHNITQDTYFHTIQAAIDAAADGNVIEVGPGTYAEAILLNKPNITVKSTDGAAATIISTPDGVLTTGVQVLSNMGTVTFDGFTVSNFTENGIVQSRTNAPGTAFIVKNNVITPANDYLRNGIQVSGDGSQVIGNTVNGAPLTDTWSSAGIMAVEGSNILIEGNTILGGTLGVDIGIDVYAYSIDVANIIIRNNTISDAGNGIRLEGGATSRTITNVLIESNTVDRAIRAINSQYVTLIDIEAHLNKFLNITDTVLRISDSSALGSMDATHNWFGHVFGPQNPIVGDVQVIQWCADEGCTTFAPQDGKITLTSADSQVGAIKIYVPGISYYLTPGTVLQNSSPCFEVYADDVHIYTDYPAAAKCVPTEGSDGIWVADGVENLRVVNLEFDGTGQTTGDGIHFEGVVTNFQIINNYFHDLGGDAIEFVGAPAGTIQDVYGNYFVGTNGIALGDGTLNAAYNSWGTSAAPTAPTGVTVAPHTHAEIYVTPAVGGEVLKDSEVVFTVNGKIQSLTGAEFELSYPTTQLQLVSAVANETTWDQYALVDTSVAGKITVALSANAAISGDPVEMLTLTFKALAYADDLTLTFSETADVFAMYPLPEPNYSNYVYTFAQTGVTDLDIIGLPVVTITMGPEPYYAGIPIPFEVEVDNTNGGTYTGLTFDIDLPVGSVLEYFDGTNWVAATLPFTVGELDPDEILTFEFRVTLDQPGVNTIAIDLMNGTESIGSDSVTITIAGNFNVLGTFAMQGRTIRSGIPVIFTIGDYAPEFATVDLLLDNLSGTLQYGGTYTITTNQPRYLNVTADLAKTVDVYADVTLEPLTLRAGNAIWTDNIIDVNDASKVTDNWGVTVDTDADVNFDLKVNIQDLALVGGNMDLTSAAAYGTWVPVLPVPAP